MSVRFNPAPGWPHPPEGWWPDQGWRPDPTWPLAPPGWSFWVTDSTAVARPTTSLSVLLPLRTWWRDGSWHRGRLGVFAIFALLPFLLLRATATDEDITRAAWGFSIYFGIAWLLAMRALIAPEPQDRWLMVRVAGFTGVVGVPLAVVLERWSSPDSSGPLGWILGVGVPEELAKALAVYLFVHLSARPWTPRTFLFLGVLSGITFGVVEAVVYTTQYQDLAAVAGAPSTTTASLWRLLTDGLFHGCLTGITAFFIGLAHWHRARAGRLIMVGLSITCVLHGLYDATSSGWIGTGFAAAIIAVFAGYVRGGDDIALRLGAEGGC